MKKFIKLKSPLSTHHLMGLLANNLKAQRFQFLSQIVTKETDYLTYLLANTTGYQHNNVGSRFLNLGVHYFVQIL